VKRADIDGDEWKLTQEYEHNVLLLFSCLNLLLHV
jgi:hypothetical protein